MSNLISENIIYCKGYEASTYAPLIKKIQNSEEPIIAVVKDESEAAQLHSDLSEIMKHANVGYLHGVEVLAYDHELPASSIVSARGQLFNDLMRNVHYDVIVMSVNAMLTRFSPKSHWLDSVLSIRLGDKINIDGISQELDQLAYTESLVVDDYGQYSFRNDRFDIFPVGSSTAFRIITDISTGKITEIRQLNTSTQLSYPSEVEVIRVMPIYEFPFSADVRTTFRVNWRKNFKELPYATKERQYVDVTNGQIPYAAYSYLPLFTEEKLISIFDILPNDGNVSFFFSESAIPEITTQLGYAQSRYDDIYEINNGFILPVAELWVGVNELIDQISRKKIYTDGFLGLLDGHSRSNAHKNTLELQITDTGISRQPSVAKTVSLLKSLMRDVIDTIFIINSEVRLGDLRSLLKYMRLPYEEVSSWNDLQLKTRSSERSEKRTFICRGNLRDGYFDNAESTLVITEKELYGLSLQSSDSEKNTELLEVSTESRKFQDLELGDPVIHLEYGVCRFEGFESKVMQNSHAEMMRLGFKDGSTQLVYPYDADLVSPYSRVNNESKLDFAYMSKSWLKGFEKAELDVRTASAGLRMFNKHRSEFWRSEPCMKPDFSYMRFCSEFPYPLTIDQEKAVQDVINDLTSTMLMNRMVSGDVGFGKTEVAMRAAYLAAATGYQVSVLVPTGILATQHYDSFKKRFENTQFKIELLSASTSKEEEKRILEDLKNGVTDIVIGTTRLLQRDVSIQALGLVIIDEEHRFGVKDKESLTEMSKGMNILTMTATPIPRSIGQALNGIKSLSVIATPPAKRLSVRSYAVDHNSRDISEAVKRELSRNGQVFVIHNLVKTISERAAKIQKEFPDVVVGIIHGQMKPDVMESIIMDFYMGKIDILVATTVVEVGLDIANANTIIIDNADHLGLAQLHQLRGRVGRSHRQAYAYFTRSESITPDGEKRMIALLKTSRIGKGAELARYDLEIRGAGEILGSSQSGSMVCTGYDLYMSLLNWYMSTDSLKKTSAVQNLLPSKNNKYANSRCTLLTDPHTDLRAEIPSTYIFSSTARFAAYHQILNATEAELPMIQRELSDMYGALPLSVQVLLLLSEYRKKLSSVDVSFVSISKRVSTFRMNAASEILEEYNLNTCDSTKERIVNRYGYMAYCEQLEGETAIARGRLNSGVKVKAKYNEYRCQIMTDILTISDLRSLLESIYLSALSSNKYIISRYKKKADI